MDRHDSPASADPAPVGERLVSGPGQTTTTPNQGQRQAPAAAVAVHLAQARAGKGQTRIHLASSDRRAEEIGRALAGVAPDIEVLVLPPWDCLPFDRASPGREVMGRRMSVLRRLANTPGDRVLIVSPESLLQRTPPAEAVAASFDVVARKSLDRDALFAFAQATGYVTDDRVDEPGEIALLGEVVDIYPADAALPVRIVVDADGAVIDLRTYDPLTQRSDGALASLTLGPASELVLQAADEPSRPPGIEHRMGAHYPAMPSLFDLVTKAKTTCDPLFDERLAESLAQIADAREAHQMLRAAGDAAIPETSSLYLGSEEVAAGLKGWRSAPLMLPDIAGVASVAGARNPGRAFCELVEAERAAGRRVVLTGLSQERRALARALGRGLHLTPAAVDGWADVEGCEPGAVLSLDLDLDTGFVDRGSGLTVMAAADVLGGRLASRGPTGDRSLLAADPDLRLGDVVLHEDHGIGVLRELQTVEIDGVAHDTLRLEYHGGASVLAPIDEIGRIWRYGAEEEAVSLDRLKGDAWPKRRAEVSRHMDEAAARLVELAKVRAAAVCEPIIPPATAYARFAARFGYPETPDQGAAIAAVLADLACGRPMDRLICGDVGFGKTEVALRAAAAVALSGRQVALCAPTTVLAKQHFQTFQRRFAGTGIKVEQLSRLVAARDAKAVRQAIAEGDANIVVGTHALASEQVAFADLGLMIIDEEQKFGAAVKQRLRELADGGHLLSMTATPIPRTLQSAMIGVQDVSVIASPPARRRPIRTFLAPFDPASVRTALLREKRRGGQSFLVAPRIEDIAPLAAQLEALAPELSVRVAHGGLPADDVDSVMVGFAEGEGDVLLATNIIESGLDVPCANTMIIWRPDRFGLSQLHQLRGRVGRGRAQGIAYLLHDPNEDLPDATRARLSTLEAFDRLGSGLAISARDLDLRGAGDLTGEDQAGHMQMIGAALYHRLLDRAIREAKGEAVEDASQPAIQLGERGLIPTDHVPDAVTRINLYGRLARLASVEAIDDFEDEVQDRFGALPPELSLLITQARLAALARAAGLREVSAGPKGIALKVSADRAQSHLEAVKALAEESELKGDRLIVPLATDLGSERLEVVERLLTALAG
jgi:transcription-repair coupling factor (superfamily II helicase)